MSLFERLRQGFLDQTKRHSERLEIVGTCLFVAGSVYIGASLYRPECEPEFFSSKDGAVQASNFCHGYSEVVLKNYVRNGVVGDLAFLIRGRIEQLGQNEQWRQPYHAEFRPDGQLKDREFFSTESLEFSKLVQESEYARERLFLEPQE
ncbi:MAG: hypothetical protein HY512_02350 [Candidatus Aenigmarchaeota archaeon]|nr:hypothetical protein [Candidatus Aenigmarchaeota archaeon]